MTATAPVTPARGPADPAPGRHAGLAGLLQAEWTKIRSVRSTVWTLVTFVVVCIGWGNWPSASWACWSSPASTRPG
jgi:hypothetical protein